MNKADETLRVCIVALNAYPAVEPSAGKAVGGAEMRAWNLAIGLSHQPGVEVFFMVSHTRPLVTTQVEDVTLVPIVDRFRDIRFDVSRVMESTSRFPWCRLLGWNSKVLWQFPLLIVTRPFRDRRPLQTRISGPCEQLMPDICIGFGLGAHSAGVVRAAERIRRPAIAAIASNAELDERFLTDPDYINHYGDSSADSRYVIEHASAIVCQTEWQQDRLRELTGRDSFVVPTPIRLERWLSTPSDGVGEHVLWIGRYDDVYKRPQLCLEIARRCPNIPFVMVINRGDAVTERNVRRSVTDNVQIVDYVQRDKMPELFRRSRLFLSTGQSEGFPNVFLEAAASGVPIVTLEDFGDFVSNSKGGVCTHGNLEQAANTVRKLWDDQVVRERHAQDGEEWVRKYHSLEAVATSLRTVIDHTCNDQGSSPEHSKTSTC